MWHTVEDVPVRLAQHLHRLRHVQYHGARHLETIVPVLARNAGIVHFAGDDLEGLALKKELAAGDLKAVARGCGSGACTERENDSGEKHCEL
jgi:hypothetical protein